MLVQVHYRNQQFTCCSENHSSSLTALSPIVIVLTSHALLNHELCYRAFFSCSSDCHSTIHQAMVFALEGCIYIVLTVLAVRKCILT